MRPGAAKDAVQDELELQEAAAQRMQIRKRMLKQTKNQKLSPEGFTYKYIDDVLEGETTSVWKRRMRMEEISEIGLTRSVNLVTAGGRGIATRAMLRRKAEDRARRRKLGAVDANEFMSRFTAVMHSEEEQHKLGILKDPNETNVKKLNMGDQLLALEEEEAKIIASEQAEPEPLAIKTAPKKKAKQLTEEELIAQAKEKEEVSQANAKLGGVFAERARKRREARARKQLQEEPAAQ